MPGFICIDVISDGTALHSDDVYDTAPWWVVYVLAEGDMGCVYGGRAGTVRRCLTEHATYGRLLSVVAYPFEGGHESNAARTKIENHYKENRRVEDHSQFGNRGGSEHARGRRDAVPA